MSYWLEHAKEGHEMRLTFIAEETADVMPDPEMEFLKVDLDGRWLSSDPFKPIEVFDVELSPRLYCVDCGERLRVLDHELRDWV